MQVVVFGSTNARVITTEDDSIDYKDMSNVLVNPDLTSVHGVPPHFWKLVHGRVEPMDQHEKAERLKDLEHDKTNTYGINDMYLKVESLQQALSARDEECKELLSSHLETLSSLRDEHEKRVEVLREVHKYDCADFRHRIHVVSAEKDSFKAKLSKTNLICKLSFPIIYLIGVLCGYVIWH